MNKKSIAILCLTALYSILFYQQHVGINFILFTIFALIFFFFQDKKAFKDRAVLLMSLSALLSACFAFVHNSNLSMWTTIVTLFILPGVFMNRRSSIMIDLGSTLYSIVVAPAFMIIDTVESSKNNKGKGNSFLRMLKYIVPLVFVISFFFIYRAMNPLFENLTRDIADFVSIGWMFFTLGGLILVYAFYKQRRSKKLDDWEKNWKLQLVKEDEKEPKWNEGVAFTLLFVVLNIMLLLVNAMDVNYLYLGAGMPEGISHKQFVHKGVGMLILSIVLGITILLYFFRGFLNFSNYKNGFKVLAILWVAQNAFMVFSTGIRNTMYVDAALLTYKRIGVFFWLFFALLGLVTLFIKLYKNKSVWYLARYNFTILYIVLLASSAFDWDMIISNFNIGRAKQMTEISSLDKNYLLSISEGNIKDLFDIKELEGFEIDSVYSYQGFGTYHISNSNGLDHKVYRFLADEEKGDWRSFSLRRESVKEDIAALDESGKLTKMDLQSAYIKGVVPLAKLKNLRELNLNTNNYNLVTQIAELNQLPKLQKLLLNQNYITSLDSLTENKNLNHLSLVENQLNNLRFLTKLPNLDSLDMSRNQLISLSTLPKMERLAKLNLSGNPLNNVNKLKQLTQLKELGLSDIMNNVGQLPEMQNLEKLSLSASHKIVQYGLHHTYPNLIHLDLARNGLKSIQVLLREEEGQTIAPKLTSLVLSGNEMATLYGIAYFQSLKHLDVSYNSIYNVSEIADLTQLKYLNLSHNRLTDLLALENLVQIEQLDLGHNSGIKSYSSLKALENLNYLNLNSTSFSNLNAINSKAPIHTLNLASCRINDWKRIKEFKHITRLTVSYITMEDAKFFKHLKNLKYLDVSQSETEVKEFLRNELDGVEVY